MRFSHIRDKNGQLRATIATELLDLGPDEGPDEDTVAYGVCIVSQTEDPNSVNSRKGRAIAGARCEAAKNEGIERYRWSNYDGTKARSNMFYNTLGHSITVQLGKFGLGSRKTFPEIIRALRRWATSDIEMRTMT